MVPIKQSSAAVSAGEKMPVTEDSKPSDFAEDLTVPEVESLSTSSGIASHEDTDSEPETSIFDPFADVRERMEDLASRDRETFALHTANNSCPRLSHDFIPPIAAFTTYLSFLVMISCGHIRDICSRTFGYGRYVRKNSGYPSDNTKRYARVLKNWENFFTRRVYHRIQDCFNRPLASTPGAHIDILERVSTDGNKTMDMAGSKSELSPSELNRYKNGPHYKEVSGGRIARSCVNLGSYNYLGFADDWEATSGKSVKSALNEFPVSTGSSRMNFGTTTLHREVEQLVASFLGKEDALALNMGFNTNATTIPALVGSGDLIISDQLNHTSIINGARASGAAIRIFHHNDTKDLEKILREAIIMGRPRTRRPWNKILVAVEGVYSMEGEYCDLRNVVSVAKKYGAYVYLDEAHSIGAMGATGRGISEYTGVETKDIDIMMGTFTKSFAGMGGYIAASKEVISTLRAACAGSSVHNSLSPVVCQQIVTSFKVIMGQDGTDLGKQKLRDLRDNSNYFRMRLMDMGVHVLGQFDSPIVPVMLYNPTKIASFSRECLKRGLAVVVVGFPAVPAVMSRVRFCISAGHTREDLDKALKEIEEIAIITKGRYALVKSH